MNLPLAELSSFQNALLLAAAISLACAALSVIVVLRKWAFIGEGISHAAFGGIGSAWLLSLALPALDGAAQAYAIAVLFCLATALSIGYICDRERVSADAAIGIFLVASLAWGFLALAIYRQIRPTGGAEDWERYLFGEIAFITPAGLSAGLAVSAGILLALGALHKEITYYAFDPLMARVSGVRSAFIHYLLMILLALAIVIGMRLAGNVLMTALLVLPGATALLLSRRLRIVIILSMAFAVVGSLGGLSVNHYFWPRLPAGPGIVLMLFVEFVLAYGVKRVVIRR